MQLIFQNQQKLNWMLKPQPDKISLINDYTDFEN